MNDSDWMRPDAVMTERPPRDGLSMIHRSMALQEHVELLPTGELRCWWTWEQGTSA